MAFTPTAAVVRTSPGVVIADTPITYMLTITNSGSTAANVVSIQPVVKLANGQPSNASIPPVAIPTGWAVQIGATSSWSFPFTITVPGPQCPGAPAQGSGVFVLDCYTTTSDGSVTSLLYPQTLAVAPDEPAQQSAVPTPGQLSFTSGVNSPLWFYFA
ncbi:MAG TPA: hypothetical protein VIU40_08280 [Geobacteraceae bacterium]